MKRRHAFALGLTPEAGTRQVLRYWKLEPKYERPGCAHCGADPLAVVDFCEHCIRPVCERCRHLATVACVRQEVAS